jgi:predicted O-methyltransferase YrrM
MHHNWSHGYVTDLTYSHGYYHELAPPFIRFFLLMNGLANGQSRGRYDYCELGFGQGVSCNLNAAANPRGDFTGTDFQPEHALFARGLAAQAGLRAHWLAHGFDEMLDLDLPQFDFITLHGVWSWIDAKARAAVVEFLRRKLKLGGVVYMSYNVMPGWSAEKPLRDLLYLHAEGSNGSAGGTDRRIRAAVEFAQRLREGKAAFFDQNARAGQMVDDLQRDDVQVVAHEYFNRSWHVTYFADLLRDLDPAGLSFACSLHRSDLVGEVFHRARGLGLGEYEIGLRQTAHDFVLNRRFRRDVFVRGADRLSPAHRDALLCDVALVPIRAPGAISPAQQTPYGSVTLDATITRRIARVMDAATGPVRIGPLIEQADLANSPRERVFETLAALVAQSLLSPVFSDDAAAADPYRTGAINAVIAERARTDNFLRYLASPVTGQALEASRPERLLAGAWAAGARNAEALTAAAWPAQAAATGACEADAGIRNEFLAQASQFLETTAPVWQRLGILQQEVQG